MVCIGYGENNQCRYIVHFIYNISYMNSRFTAICLLMAEDGHLYGNTHIWKHYLSPLTCTTSQITTKAVLPMTVDGVIYPIRNASIQQNK